MAGTESQQPLITNTTTCTETSGRFPRLSETNNVGYTSPVSPGDEQEAGEAGAGGASVKCGGSRLDEKCLRRGGGGGGRGSDGCYWSFFSDSESSLASVSSGGVSSYLERRNKCLHFQCISRTVFTTLFSFIKKKKLIAPLIN